MAESSQTTALFGLPAFFQSRLSIAVPTEARPGLSWAQVFFAAGMIALGITGLVNGDFALVWQRLPVKDMPGREYLAYASALLELTTGIGLLLRRTVALASRILFVFLVLWVLLLEIPPVVKAPLVEDSWASFSEIVFILAGGWVLFALHAGPWAKSHLGLIVGANGVRCARLLLILTLPMEGLEHFLEAEPIASFVPAWLPFHLFWAYLTGAGSIATSLGMLFGILPRLAATLQAVNFGCIALFTWGAILDTGRTATTAFLISLAMAFGIWVVAESYRGTGWLSVGIRGAKASSQ